MSDAPQDQWAGTIKCGCGSLTVLLVGPAHLFVRRNTMLQYACGEEHPFTEDEDGRLICSRCHQEITATRSTREGSADQDTSA